MMKPNKSTNKNKKIMVIIWLFISFIVIVSATFMVYNNERNIAWRKDIDYLSEELPKNHVNLFFKLSEKEFNKEIKILKRNVYKLNDDEIMIELMKIFAAIGDEHTNINYSDGNRFPLKFYWFEDGIYVIDTIPEYNEIKECRLSKINGVDINEIVKEVANLIPNFNNQWVKYNTPSLLVAPNILYGIDIIDSKDKETFTFINNEDVEFSMDIKSSKADTISWIDKESESLPLHMQNTDKFYWFEYMTENNLIYYKHDVCRDQKENPSIDFSIELFNLIKEKNPDKLILDLRDNSGGDSRYIDNIIDKINLTAPELNAENKLYIITGRKTFSSAVLNCLYARANSNAIFIGEATGGNPNGYGEVLIMELPNSKKKLSYSIKKFESFDKAMNTFEPDINVEINSTDYFEDRDPVFEAIISN